MKSYSLTDCNKEYLDKKLYNVFQKKKNGFFIELGANDGLKQSNTAMFEKHLGWKGILIEPSLKGFELCKKNRPNSICLNCACVSKDYDDMYISGDFENNHLKISKKLIENFDFNYFDLIIDNQTRLKNTFIYRKIPHKYFISPSLNYLFSKPLFFTKKKKNLLIRLLFYMHQLLHKIYFESLEYFRANNLIHQYYAKSLSFLNIAQL